MKKIISLVMAMLIILSMGVFADDVMHATKEILIVSPFMRKNRLTQTIKLLSQVILNGVSVTVVTRPPEDFKEITDADINNVWYVQMAKAMFNPDTQKGDN